MNIINFLETISRMSQQRIKMCKEEDLLNEIAKITNWHIANEVRDILFLEEHHLLDIFYLIELDAVVQALLAGIPEDELLIIITNKDWFIGIGDLINAQRELLMKNGSLWTREQIEIMAKKIEEIRELCNELEQKNRIEIYQYKQCGSIKNRTWHQVNAQKYKRYELRIYSRTGN